MNPAVWLQRTARRLPDAPALQRGLTVEDDYGGFSRVAAKIGAGLAAQGVRPGDRVAVFMANGTDYLRALYGIWWAGATAVPINAKLHAREAAWILADAGAKIAFVTNKLGRGLADVNEGGCILIASSSEDWTGLLSSTPMSEPLHMARDDMAWLFYTSGTTGKPKGVMITAGNIEAMTLSYFADVDDVLRKDAILYAAPMSHGAGLYNFMHVLRGCRHVVPDSCGFDPHEIFDLSTELGSVHLFAAPTMVKRLVDAAKQTGASGEGLRSVVYAGGPMYLADILEAVDVLGDRFMQVYGQGECPMCITALSRSKVSDRTHPRWRERLASVGRAQSVCEVAVMNEAGEVLPTGEKGEIAVRGQAVMKGYWNRPEATAATLRDGWLWTGDLGSIDEHGYLTLHDRSKDLIISGGSNIYPREVEEVLLEHGTVHEVSVVGRPHPEWGEEVIAFVVPAPGMNFDAAVLDSHCLDRIARFKRPKDYVAVRTLPKNAYGKVLKTELRRRLSGGRTVT